jgi:hypothetical protein
MYASVAPRAEKTNRFLDFLQEAPLLGNRLEVSSDLGWSVQKRVELWNDCRK